MFFEHGANAYGGNIFKLNKEKNMVALITTNKNQKSVTALVLFIKIN